MKSRNPRERRCEFCARTHERTKKVGDFSTARTGGCGRVFLSFDLVSRAVVDALANVGSACTGAPAGQCKKNGIVRRCPGAARPTKNWNLVPLGAESDSFFVAAKNPTPVNARKRTEREMAPRWGVFGGRFFGGVFCRKKWELCELRAGA